MPEREPPYLVHEHINILDKIQPLTPEQRQERLDKITADLAQPLEGTALTKAQARAEIVARMGCKACRDGGSRHADFCPDS